MYTTIVILAFAIGFRNRLRQLNPERLLVTKCIWEKLFVALEVMQLTEPQIILQHISTLLLPVPPVFLSFLLFSHLVVFYGTHRREWGRLCWMQCAPFVAERERGCGPDKTVPPAAWQPLVLEFLPGRSETMQCARTCVRKRDLTHFTKSIVFKIVSPHISFLLSLQHVPEGAAGIHLSYATFVGSQREAQRGEASISWVGVWLALGWTAKYLYLEERKTWHSCTIGWDVTNLESNFFFFFFCWHKIISLLFAEDQMCC